MAPRRKKKGRAKTGAARGATGNRRAIEKRKEKLEDPSLSEGERKRIAEGIRKRGGKVKLGNFPTTTPPAGQAPGTPAAGPPADPQRPTFTGGLGQGLNIPGSLQGDPNLQKALDIIGLGSGLGGQIADQFFAPGSLQQAQVGTTLSPELQALQTQLQQQASVAGEIDPEIQAIIERRRAGLEGFDPQERRLIEEQQISGLDRDFAEGLSSLRSGAARAGLRGRRAAAAESGLAAERFNTLANLRRDLAIQNIQERQSRLSAFQDLVTGAQQQRFGQQQQALGSLGNFLGGQQQVQAEQERFNIAQEEARRRGALQAGLGGIGALTGLLGAERGQDLAQKNIELTGRELRSARKGQRKAEQSFGRPAGF